MSLFFRYWKAKSKQLMRSNCFSDWPYVCKYVHRRIEITMEEDLITFESRFLKAIGQPTRLKILYFLKDGEKCACKIIPRMKEDQSSISRHLTSLKNAGILESRKEGVSVYYRIKDKRVFSILNLVDGILKAQVREEAKLMKVL